jgi:hypothetical protein
VIILAIIAFFVFRRRRKVSKLAAIGYNSKTIEYNHEQKPELPGNDHGEFNGAEYSRKPELDTIAAHITPVAELAQAHSPHPLPELDSQARTSNIEILPPNVPELGSDPGHTKPSELDTNSRVQGANTLVSPPMVKSSNQGQGDSIGPLPLPSELYPTINVQEEDLDEEELRYQEQRLRERRALIAEKEKLAIEEERLRRIRAKKGENSRPGL